MYNQFENLVKNRQACRDFNDEPLDKNSILELARLATLAPSACNSQPWKMYVVTEKEKVDLVADCLQDRGINTFVKGAKAFIVISEKTPRLRPDAEKRFHRDFFVKYDIGEVIAYLTLGAKAKGIETCILGWVNHEKIKEAVGLPEGELSNIVIAFGHSDTPLREKIRKSIAETVIEVK